EPPVIERIRRLLRLQIVARRDVGPSHLDLAVASGDSQLVAGQSPPCGRIANAGRIPESTAGDGTELGHSIQVQDAQAGAVQLFQNPRGTDRSGNEPSAQAETLWCTFLERGKERG